MSVVWDTWAEVGMAARLHNARNFDSEGDHLKDSSLLNREAIAAFQRVLAQPLPVVVVSAEDFPARVEQYRGMTVATLLAKQPALKAVTAHARPELRTTYVAPRNLVESTLASIWQQLLAIEKIGVEDNFFDLGGDSVVSLQVASQARQAGLQLTPKQVFQYQTIAELAAVVDSGGPSMAEQGLVTGSVLLTPIQRWFFRRQFADCHHYNQSVMVELRRRVSDDDLRQSVTAVLHHHDALRMRYAQSDGVWEQRSAGIEDAVPFAVQDLSKVANADLAETITQAAEQVQGSLDLRRGPLARFVLFDCGSERAQRVLVVIHHLVVDAVSWRVLLEDLETVLRQLAEGRTIQLPAKTTSFKHWAEHLVGQAAARAFDSELDYWLSEGAKAIEPLPRDMLVEQE
jgi:aryl carrier-like protein